MSDDPDAVLDPLTLPLSGSQLIEASAGTGKTWAIAALYLRLVVGHGCKPLLPGEILVMTFTRAATRELSDRIRSRLVQAAARFRGEPAQGEDDFLLRLLEAFPAGAARQQAAWRLGMAAELMDDAAVHTIDAWCQRMLREHAFDSGCLFDEELQAHEAPIRAEAVRDYWRQHVYPLAEDALQSVLAQWKSLDAMAEDVESLVTKPLPPDAGRGTLAQVLARATHEQREQVASLKAGWGQRSVEMLEWLTVQWARDDCPIDKRKLGVANGTRWIEALRSWAEDAAAVSPTLGKGVQRLTHAGIFGSFKPGASVEIPAPFNEFATLMAALQALPEVGPKLRLHAAANVAARMEQLKAQSGIFGFADMQNRLEAALDERAHGERAQHLRDRIVAQFPAALIDEFQDTSPQQLRIFDSLYRIASNDPARALLLIGDPKQAIYSFRGADIHSYLVAREATRGRHHLLGTNYRSTPAVVSAINDLFGAAERRAGEGAFMLRQAGAASALPFAEVQARERAERLVTCAGMAPAMTLVADDVLRNKQDSIDYFAALCAERIVVLLNDAQTGFEREDLPFERLRPADIAVLVRNRREAAAVRREMRRRGLTSVYLSDQDSVLQTDEAGDLLRLLQAVAAPRDAWLARAALATRLLGFTLPELVAMATDDERFDLHCEQLRQLNQVWKAQGVLAMLRRALHEFGMPARWLARGDAGVSGERRLTNVLHLAELLQAASAQAQGEQALIRWLAQQIADGEQGPNGGDELVLRLESDANLVKVVTVHKAKGLEYPVVFVPFAALFRDALGTAEKRNPALMVPDETGWRRLALSPTEAQIERAEKERLREDLRLLYVALTRARHALWVGLCALQVGTGKKYVWHCSAIGYLLSGPELQPPAQRIADLQSFADGKSAVALELLASIDSEASVPPLTTLRPRAELPDLVPAPSYEAIFERNWSISSYSALVRDAVWGPGRDAGAVPVHLLRDDEPDDAVEPDDLERFEPNGQGSTERRGDEQPWHRFPRGAQAGNFLHDQLEWLAAERFALDSSAALRDALVRRCERQGWGRWSADVVQWLRKVCATSMPAPGVALSALATSGSAIAEMEFWYPGTGLRAGAVDALCRQHLQPGVDRPQLPERALHGMLMGFADLVFEHAGRYWVLDYKSNALGLHDVEYTREAMDAAMLQHRYDVQAALYLLALHRLLKLRLGSGYVPAQHLGGAVYFFLRGVGNATAGCCHVAAPLALLETLDGMLRDGVCKADEEAA